MKLDLLTSDRLILRAPGPNDLATLFAIHRDPHTNRHNPGGPMKSQEEALATLQTWLKHWQAYDFGYWAAARKETPETVIGFGGLRWRELEGERRPNLYFRFAPPAWRHGYATELGRAALQMAWTELVQPAVYATTRPDNLASIRTLERLGLKCRGELLDEYGTSLLFVIEKP